MLGRVRVRPVAWLVAIATLGATAGMLAVVSPSGAATEKVYESETTAECVLAPGVLNETGTVIIKNRGEGPAMIAKGEQFELKNSTINLTTPAKWGENLYGIGARQSRGNITDSEVEWEGGTPSPMNAALPEEFSSGLPFKTAVRNEAVSFSVPSEGRSFVTGPVTVTASGGSLILRYDPVPGFKQIGETAEHRPLFESTHRGFQAEFNGYAEPEAGRFEKIIGPLEGSCTEPKGSAMGNVPIVSASSSSSTSSSSTTSSHSSTTTTGSTSSSTTTSVSTTTTTSTSAAPIHVKLNDKLSGYIQVKKLENQKVVLPEDCTFIGEGEIPGPFEANTKCPAFTASFKLLGLPASIGTELVQSEAVKGSIVPNNETGKLLISGAARDNIKITSLGLLFLTIPVSCETAEPVAFPLRAEVTAGELISTGASSHGEITLPAVKCKGLLGGVVGPLLSLLMSGPSNAYEFAIKP